MVLREGRRGPFLACTGYPKCKNAKDVDAEGNPVKPIETGIKCEKCGSRWWSKQGPRAVPGLQRLPEVPQHQAAAGGAEGEAQGPDAGAGRRRRCRRSRSRETCPECGSPMKLRRGRGGVLPGLHASTQVQGHARGDARNCWKKSANSPYRRPPNPICVWPPLTQD